MNSAELLYFNPDPAVPDSDLLGYGDLVYSNGRTEYLSGDEELAAMLPRPPPGVEPQGAVGMGPPPPVTIDSPQGPLEVDYKDPENPIKPAGGFTGALNSLGNMLTGGIPQEQGGQGLGDMLASGVSRFGSMMGGGMPTQQPAPQRADEGLPQQTPPPPVVIDSPQGPLAVDYKNPENPIRPATADDLQTVGREGALPPDVAQRQLSQMDAMQQQSLQVAEQARADEARLMNEATLKAMAQNEAQWIAQQEDIAEQQAKAERAERERQMVAEMEIDRSLSGAVGVMGAVMAVIGSALMASTGSDAGGRMIENTIDRHVREQVRKRDTQLNLLSERLGSAQQAIKMGKAEMYRLGAEKAELLLQKTKNDIYEAQTPAVLQAMRQKSLENLQEAERISLGKAIERVPEPAKPPNPATLEKYGQLRRERDAASDMVSRMEQQAGLIWEPGKDGQPGHYRNGAEVIKNGIEGIGAIEQWVPDFVYSTMGQKEGYQIRGAKQALAFAVVRQMQPTGPITDIDRKVGEAAATMDTEAGLIQTLERLRNAEEQQRANDAAQYTPQVVAEYERQYRASGGQQQPGSPSPSRSSTLEEKRRAADAMGQPTSSNATEIQDMTPEQRMGALNESLAVLAQEKSIPPEGVAILMAQAGHETNDGKNMPTNNFFGMKSSQRNRNRGAGVTNLMTTEGAGANAKRVAQNFATFDSANDAAMDMLSLLERKYPRAFEALQVGDADGYVAALKDGGYFTGNEGAYVAGILRRL